MTTARLAFSVQLNHRPIVCINRPRPLNPWPQRGPPFRFSWTICPWSASTDHAPWLCDPHIDVCAGLLTFSICQTRRKYVDILQRYSLHSVQSLTTLTEGLRRLFVFQDVQATAIKNMIVVKRQTSTLSWRQSLFRTFCIRFKTHKRLKERFLSRRNRTKRANVRGSHLFQATYNNHKNPGKQTINST